MGVARSRLEDLAERLDALSEELGDVSIDLLREAIATGAGKRPDEDKRIAQARRAIDKAAHILRHTGADDADGSDGSDGSDD